MYKLVQHLRDYINPKGEKSPVKIKLHMTRNWLHRPGFKYKNIKKDVFVNEHEQPDVIEDRERFLKIMEELKPYMVGFNEDGIMKDKEYSLDYIIGRRIRKPIIMITYDKCMFSANDGIYKAWTQVEDTFLRPKRRRQGIMVFKFLLPFGRLNLFSLSEEKQKEVMKKMGLTILEVVELYEYGKNNEGY